METRKLLSALVLVLFLSGCMVFSFYPLYNEKDLFPNDLLTGEWLGLDQTNMESAQDDSGWKFEHPYSEDKENTRLDSCEYVLSLTENDKGKVYHSNYIVHVIQLDGHYFLDFYLKDFPIDGEIRFSDLHMIPVHTFAKLTVSKDSLVLHWFDPDWLKKLIKENKIRIHHEDNDETILLTAEPEELQKFVSKYADSEDAFDDGLKVVLKRK